MNMLQREARRAEVERDLRLVSLDLLQALEILVDGELARLMREQASAAPFLLLDELEALAMRFCEDLSRLNAARTEPRTERGPGDAALPPLPERLAAFRHRGRYHGAFASMAELGRALGLGLGLPETWLDASATAALASGLHRRGEIWTFERSGVIHVFCRPNTAADQVLATRAEHPTAVPHDCRVEAHALRLVPQPA